MSRKEVPRAGLLKAALAGRITNAQGARALGLSTRQFRRLKRRFREGGARGLFHALRGRPGNRRLAPQAREQVGVLMTTTYAGFNDVHLTEKLREVHQLAVSRSSVRSLRLALGRSATLRRSAPRAVSHQPSTPGRAAVAISMRSRSGFWLDGQLIGNSTLARPEVPPRRSAGSPGLAY